MTPDDSEIDFEIKLLLETLFFKYNSDFRNYSRASIRRRLNAAKSRMGFHSLSQLQGQLLADSSVYDSLLQFLTVPTSEMFRDPTYFLALRKEVFPSLATYPFLKLWIAGCSTGEELYSMAILLEEEGLLKRSILYATDINPRSLKSAEAGAFNLDEIQKFTLNYQKGGGRAAFSDYYQVSGDRAIFHDRFREKVVFADHSLATDSVFAEVQFISCRNVLIYFNRELQDRAFGLFRDSLSYRGFLGLGAKESLRFSPQAANFEEFMPREKIYRKKAVS